MPAAANLIANGGFEAGNTGYSGSNTSANISMVNLNTAFDGNDFGLDSLTFDTVIPVPEPASLALLGMGLLGLGAVRSHRRAG